MRRAGPKHTAFFPSVAFPSACNAPCNNPEHTRVKQQQTLFATALAAKPVNPELLADTNSCANPNSNAIHVSKHGAGRIRRANTSSIMQLPSGLGYTPAAAAPAGPTHHHLRVQDTIDATPVQVDCASCNSCMRTLAHKRPRHYML